MKALLFVFSFLLTLCQSLEAQNTVENLGDRLLGYWHFEGVDSSDYQAVQYSLKEVHKLHFTEDSLRVSNFGDQEISSIGAYWSCTKGEWAMNKNTLYFTPQSTINFSTNTGFYSVGRGPVLDISCVLKEIGKDRIEVALTVPKRWQSVITNIERPEMEVVTRVYKKVPHLEMYWSEASPYSPSAHWNKH